MRQELIANQREHDLYIAYRAAVINAASNIVRPDEDMQGWYPTSNVPTRVGGEVDKEPIEGEANRLRAAAYRAYYRNPHARGIIDNLVNFTLDYGAKIVFKETEENQGLIKQVKEEWEIFARLNKFRRYQKEYFRRCLREGEQFTRILEPVKATGTGKNRKLGSPARVYFLEPDWITSNDKNITFGIETAAGDVANIKSYRVRNQPLQENDIILKPEEVLHTKIGVDMNVKRGRTMLEPVLADLTKLVSFREVRVILNYVRSSVVLHRKRSGSVGQQDAQLAKERSTRPGASPEALKLPQAGTQITTDKDTEIDFKSPNLGASEAAVDHRMIILAIAAGVTTPEFILSMDASNNNFASIREACLPLIKFVIDSQAMLEEEWQDLFKRVIGLSVAFGRLPVEALEIECAFEFEPFDIKNFLQEAQGMQILLSHNLISKTTASARFGYDFEEEIEKIAAEQDALTALGLNPFNDPNDPNNPNNQNNGGGSGGGGSNQDDEKEGAE